MERLYTTKEVANICQVSVDTVWRWIRNGLLKYKMVGRKKMVAESQLKEFIDGGN